MAPMAFVPAAAAAAASPFVGARPAVATRPALAAVPRPTRAARLLPTAVTDGVQSDAKAAADEAVRAADAATGQGRNEANDYGAATVKQAQANVASAGGSVADAAADAADDAKATASAVGDRLDANTVGMDSPSINETVGKSADAVASSAADAVGVAKSNLGSAVADADPPTADNVAAAAQKTGGDLADAAAEGAGNVAFVAKDLAGVVKAAVPSPSDLADAAKAATTAIPDGVRAVREDVASTGEALAAEPSTPKGVKANVIPSTGDVNGMAVGTAGRNAADAAEEMAARTGTAEAAATAQATREAQDRVDGLAAVQDVKAAAKAAGDGIREFSNKAMDAAQAVGDAATNTVAKTTGADIESNYGENHDEHI
eukprot:TRINITY_DN1444_c0_g1_i6.p1 TRINITY_DN1444_c0_g1~~TRINITY_DN1444_c0_g1_i6.p1  ORF type:complete len:390 (-),score=190.19 TRINITY_DN1444_c0_g1_i6:228-1346(-)